MTTLVKRDATIRPLEHGNLAHEVTVFESCHAHAC